jgi:hypothetical protein
MKWRAPAASLLAFALGCTSAFEGDDPPADAGVRPDAAPVEEEVRVVGICVESRSDGTIAVRVYAEALAGSGSYRCALEPGERGLRASAFALGGGSSGSALCGGSGPWVGPIDCEGAIPAPSPDRPYLFVQPAGTSGYDYRYPTDTAGEQCVSWPFLDFEDREGLDQVGCVSDRPCGQPLAWVRGCDGESCRVRPAPDGGVFVAAGDDGCSGSGSHGRVYCLGSEQDPADHQVSLGGELVRWDGTDACVPNP